MSEDVTPYGATDDAAAKRVEELRALTAQLGLSQRGVARELEVDERTARYWFSGQYTPPLMAILALQYLATHPEMLRYPPNSSEPKRNALAAYEQPAKNALAEMGKNKGNR